MDFITKQAARTLCQAPDFVVRLLAGDQIEVDGQKLDPIVQMMVKHFVGPPGKLYPLQELRTNMDREGRWLSHDLDLQTVPVTREVFSANGISVPVEVHRSTSLRRDEPAPVLIFIHGGGYTAGSLDSHRTVCNRLAKMVHCVVIAVDYRRAPENKFPAAIDDCLAAYDATVANCRELGIDPDRIAVGGDSAGGNAAAVIAQQRKRAKHKPKFQMLWVPWVDMTEQRESYIHFDVGYFLDKPTMEWYTKNYLPTPEHGKDPRASPILGNVRGVCPAAVLVAGFDPLRDEGLEYAEKLKKAGVPTTLNMYEGVVHPFINCAGFVPIASKAFDEAVTLLKENLRK